MIFYNKDEEELERIDISGMLRSELVVVLDTKGIVRKPLENDSTQDKL